MSTTAEALLERDNILDQDATFRRVAGHVDRRDRKQRANSPPRSSKGNGKKNSSDKGQTQNASTRKNEDEQSDSDPDDQRRRDGRHNGVTKAPIQWPEQRDISSVPRTMLGNNTYASTPHGIDISSDKGYYNTHNYALDDGFGMHAYQGYAVKYNNIISSPSTYPVPQYATMTASSSRSSQVTVGDKRYEPLTPGLISRQAAAGVVRRYAISRKSPEQLAEERKELFTEHLRHLPMVKSNNAALQCIWDDMLSTLVSNKRRREKYRVNGPGLQHEKGLGNYELFEEKEPGAQDGVYRIQHSSARRTRDDKVELVGVDELQEAGWQRESNDQYWWRYMALTDIAGLPGPVGLASRDNMVVVKVYIDGSFGGIWDPSSDAVEDVDGCPTDYPEMEEADLSLARLEYDRGMEYDEDHIDLDQAPGQSSQLRRESGSSSRRRHRRRHREV